VNKKIETVPRRDLGYALLRRAMPEPTSGSTQRFAHVSERSLRDAAYVAAATDAAVL